MQHDTHPQQLPPVEEHPFPPFLPQGARILMLGTFPPKPVRWSIPFFYPNKINDMWRIMGLIFYADKQRFWDAGHNRFDQPMIEQFLTSQGIALWDTCAKVRRLRDNASDKWLEIVETIDLGQFFAACPTLAAVVTTGEKATGVIAAMAGVGVPPIGVPVSCQVAGHPFTLWRMPSSSRAYPLALEAKAQAYRAMFAAQGYQV